MNDEKIRLGKEVFVPYYKILSWLCNKNQLYALFVFSLFHQSTSTYFGHISSPSSGGVLYIYNTYHLLYIYSVPADDGLQMCPKHVDIDW